MGEGDLRSRRRSNVQVANVGVERPTFPPLPYQGTLARCYLAVTSGPYYSRGLSAGEGGRPSVESLRLGVRVDSEVHWQPEWHASQLLRNGRGRGA